MVQTQRSGNAGTSLRGKIPPLTNDEILNVPAVRTRVALTIKPPNMQTAVIRITGLSPYVQHKFAAKARAQMQEAQQAGSRARSRVVREARNFDADYEAAQHRAAAGWNGIPASAFRNAAISACRLVGFVMTKAKLSIFVEADGFDADDGTPLVQIEGTPEPTPPMAVRNESGVADLRVRPIWRQWACNLKVRWDADQFGPEDVLNLLARAGLQVGIGEGRPDSPGSNGLGWGLFEVSP